jgi:hypothetical protein
MKTTIEAYDRAWGTYMKIMGMRDPRDDDWIKQELSVSFLNLYGACHELCKALSPVERLALMWINNVDKIDDPSRRKAYPA